MQIAHFVPLILSITDGVLDKINNFIWKDAIACDVDTQFFYTFKPYPARLKSAQIDDWSSLQIKALSPFVGGSSYHFLTSKGLCFWAAPTPFHGVPETATQQKLKDGSHYVAGSKFHYQQKWQDGYMLSCEVVDSAACHKNELETININTNLSRGWAQTRVIDDWIRKPVTWAAVSLFVSITVAVWLLAGNLALSNQLANLQKQSEQIELQLGDKLQLQNQFQQNVGLVELVNNWQFTHGHLPQALAVVIDTAVSQSLWRTNLIQWQEKTLTVELVSADLDIAKLVTNLEATETFSNVSVRPNIRPNTWDLEVTVQ